MNVLNHLRRAVSSLMREGKTPVPVSFIIAMDRLSCLFRVLVGCGGQVQRGTVWGSIQVTRSPSGGDAPGMRLQSLSGIDRFTIYYKVQNG